MEYALSVLAIVIASISLATTVRADKVQRLTQIQEVLHSVDSQRGRRLLYEVTHDSARLKALQDSRNEEWDLINRTLSTFDLVGFYRAQKWLPVSRNLNKDPVMKLWGLVLVRMTVPAEMFIRGRLEAEGHRDRTVAEAWPYLSELFADAVRWDRMQVKPAGERPEETSNSEPNSAP